MSPEGIRESATPMCGELHNIMDNLNIDNTLPEKKGSEEGGSLLLPGSDFGQYRIIRLIGRGGMGEVYEAEHATLEKRFAIKLIPDDLVAQKGFLERFKREAKVMAYLDHPHIVKVDDFGETGGHYWLRMELVNGPTVEGKCVTTLGDLAAIGNEKIAQEILVNILIEILDALSYAHAKGAIHRDIKPANILLLGNNISSAHVKMSDFGLVRLVGEEWVRSRAELSVSFSMSIGGKLTEADIRKSGTSTKALLGTFEYMSPEQKRGEEVDARSDLYAVGLIAHRMLTGQRELSYDLPSQIDTALAAGWDEVVRKAIRPARDHRFGSAQEMLTSLLKVRDAVKTIVETKNKEVERNRKELALKAQQALMELEEKKRLQEQKKRVFEGPRVAKGEQKLTCDACRAAVSPDDVICPGCGLVLREEEALRRRDDAEPIEESGEKTSRREGRERVDEPPETAGHTIDVRAIRELTTLTGHDASVFSVVFSPDGRYLASASADTTIRIWDVRTYAERIALEGHRDSVLCVAFSPDGRYLASGGKSDRLIKIWSMSSFEEIRSLEGHRNWVTSVCFSPDQRYLASGSMDRTVRVWDAKSFTDFRTLPGHEGVVHSVAFSSDSRYIAGGSSDRTVGVWDLGASEEPKFLVGHSKDIYSVAFDPQGEYVASASGDKRVGIWHAETFEVLKMLKGHRQAVEDVVFSPSGKYLASGGDDAMVIIWDMRTFELLKTMESAGDWIHSLAFSPDGRYLASGNKDGTVKIWQLSE